MQVQIKPDMTAKLIQMGEAMRFEPVGDVPSLLIYAS